MNARAMSLLAPLMMLCHVPDGGAAATASGRNWRLSIGSIDCEAAASLITIGTRIRYRGPRGPVEAPVIRLVDGADKPYLPKSLVWLRGSKPVAAWLSSGGLTNLQAEDLGEVQLKFELRDATGDLKLEFGDIRAFALTRKASAATGVCQGLLQPDRIQAPGAPRPARAEGPNSRVRIYRAAYPCKPAGREALRTTEAQYPPYVPRQLLLFGRGYLPNARRIDLPMGRAAAQPYAYAGRDELDAIENAARRALAEDFPEYGAGLGAMKYFAFNWGAQKAPGGNEVYSIGIYDVRPCAK